MPSSACRKSFAFSQTVCLFQMEKRASPLFQAFFPLPLRFFLNQAAVFRQSQWMRILASTFLCLQRLEGRCIFIISFDF